MWYYGRIYIKKCPYCGRRFHSSFFNPPVILGPGSRTCKRCQRTFNDTSKEWPLLSLSEKRSFLFYGWGYATFCTALGVGVGIHGGSSPAAYWYFLLVFWLFIALPICPIRLLRIGLSKRRYQKSSFGELFFSTSAEFLLKSGSPRCAAHHAMSATPGGFSASSRFAPTQPSWFLWNASFLFRHGPKAGRQ